MKTYRVEIDDKIVWSEDIDDPDESIRHFPPEYLSRPDEPGPEDPFPSPHCLYIGDELVGRQVALAEEQAEWDAAVVANEASGFNAAMRELANQAAVNAAAESAARHAARKEG